MQIEFDHDYKNKVMNQRFVPGSTLTSLEDVQAWRSSWTQALKAWHSPYKCLVDMSQLEFRPSGPEVNDALERMHKFFQGLFLRKAAGFGLKSVAEAVNLPFPTYNTEAEAVQFLGIRERVPVAPGDFRSSIQFENHFRQHVVELSFVAPVTISTVEEVRILKDKLTNNLMQWHSAWNLLIDCSNLAVDSGVAGEFASMLKGFKGFFLKETVGYSPMAPQDSYPFKVFRARHRAAGILESEGLSSGEAANCASKSAK